MDDDEMQQFSLRWHNHQSSVVDALGRMLWSGALADVTLSARGTTLKAHRLVLASCSHYFAQLFKEVEAESGALVVVLACDAGALRLLLTFMYTGEVTAPRSALPALLSLARALQVAGLTDAAANSTLTPTDTEEPTLTPSPVNTKLKAEGCWRGLGLSGHTLDNEPALLGDNTLPNDTTLPDDSSQTDDTTLPDDTALPYDTTPLLPPSADLSDPYGITEFMGRNDNDRLSKLDRIVQSLYSSHKIMTTPAASATHETTPESEAQAYDRRVRTSSSVCTICKKRLSNQYNLRVHMETHAGRRHACRACSHVSRSRDALRKHVAYRHALARGHL